MNTDCTDDTSWTRVCIISKLKRRYQIKRKAGSPDCCSPKTEVLNAKGRGLGHVGMSHHVKSSSVTKSSHSGRSSEGAYSGARGGVAIHQP